MNEADPPPINLDELRMVPDWLREDTPAPSKQYAQHDFGGEDDRGRRPGGGPRQAPFGRDRRDQRGAGGVSDRPRESRGRSGPPRGGGSPRPARDEQRPPADPPPQPILPAPVKVEFLPDERCLASINKQIRSTHMAYPLFGLARMFLQEPERHWVQFTLAPAAQDGTLLYQLGDDGPVTLERQTLEKIAFESAKERYYVEGTIQKDPLKGNFTNIARCRLSGTLLGPTNYHGYQPALRALYESRFSRRMPFEEYRRNIEIVSDPALIERWKEDARTTTTITTREGDPPAVLASSNEARAHFRDHHFEGLVRSGTAARVHGSVARKLPEPAMMQAIREAHERELRYPAQFVQQLRQGLQDAGLHIFKHRKRVVYVSLARPTAFVTQGAVSENVAAILEIVAASPLCTRKALADRVLAMKFGTGMNAPAPAPQTPAPDERTGQTPASDAPAADGAESAPAEQAPAASLLNDAIIKAKASLAADLRFLVQAGHLIEFHNGTFDLPLPPKGKEDAKDGPRVEQNAPAAGDALNADNLTEAQLAAEAEGEQSERAQLGIEDVTILAPAPEPNVGNAEPVASTQADGESTAAPREAGTAPDPVVMGDTEDPFTASPA